MSNSFGIISAALGIISSIAAPILWVGGIKEVQATQGAQIVELQTFKAGTEKDIKLMSKKIDLLLYKNGIDPSVILSSTNGPGTN